METDGRQYQAINRAALTECEARLEARDREIDELRADLETTLRALRYLHNFPNAPAAHANAAKIIPSDAEFDRMARANDAATPPPSGEQWEYYYKRNDCPARYATDPDCICWYSEGTGPRPNERHDDEAPVVEWRKASSHRSLDDAPHTPEHWIGTWDEQADVPLCDWKPGMRNTPEQADSYPLDSEGRCLKCGGTGRIGVDSTREPCPACNSLPPQQAHGDALAAFDRLCNWFDIPGDDDAKIPEAAYLDYQQVRRHLTASGVPEEVRRMPELFRGRARCNQQHPGHTFRSEVYEQCADELESALASAPADGWKLVPVEPTEAMIRIGKGVNPPWSVRCATPVYRAMIAAAPTDGRARRMGGSMTETTQSERERLLDMPVDNIVHSLYRDADRLARLEDGIRALANKWENEDVLDPRFAFTPSECAQQARDLLDGE